MSVKTSGDSPHSLIQIISHSHFDHHGDPNTFPDSTDLIVGPGFKANFVPSYPTKPDSGVDENAWR